MKKTIHTKEHKALIERIREARRESNLSQIQVAQKLGCSQSYISKIESGDVRIDTVELNRFAKVYGKKIGHFLQ